MNQLTNKNYNCHGLDPTDTCGCSNNHSDNEESHGQSSSCSSEGCSCPSKQSQFMNISFDGVESIPCSVLAIFDINEQAYIVLSHPDTKEHLLYRYSESIDDATLDVIMGEEFDLVAKTYKALYQ